jgi:glutathione S-transferase
VSLPRLYGDTQSRANRCLWALYEIGLPFEHVPLASAEARSPEFRAVNPTGKIPAWVEDGWTLSESLAINLHLARRHGGALWPETERNQAVSLQWTLWAATEAEPALFVAARNRVLRSPERRNEADARDGERLLAPRLAYLDSCLSQTGPYLLGARFSIADLNVAGVFSLLRASRVDLAAVPVFDRWLASLEARPAHRRAHGQ